MLCKKAKFWIWKRHTKALFGFAFLIKVANDSSQALCLIRGVKPIDKNRKELQ